jgi:hypothetical protein
MLLDIRALARAENVEDALLAEWKRSQPDLVRRSRQAASSAGNKGWRWVSEMEEIADTFAAADLLDGFHRAAAEIFRRWPRGVTDLSAVDDLPLSGDPTGPDQAATSPNGAPEVVTGA